MHPRTLLLLTLLGPCGQAFGDTLWMSNGDRLTGTLQVLAGGRLQHRLGIADHAGRKDLVSAAAGELDETRYTIGFWVGW